jgi:YHS domain-containing protein
MVHHLRLVVFSAAFIGVTLLSAGCTNSKTPSSPDSAKGTGTIPSPPKSDGDHVHKPSAHGGIIVSIGSDSYHAEAVFEKGGILRLYTLGQNEAVVLEVEAQPLTGYARLEGGTESESFVLTPLPQPADKPGMTSLFVGHLPRDMAGKKIEVTIPSIRIGSERFRIAFKSVPDASEHGMPSKVADEDERKLYLKPGGKYTEADIQANGNAVASVKFKGLKAQHDVKPQPGDKLCPISMTKANPKFSWVVNGKTYEFCCPPCVDEFVKMAKEQPDEIKEPEFYRKK